MRRRESWFPVAVGVAIALAATVSAEDATPSRDDKAVARLVSEAQSKGLKGDWEGASRLVDAARSKGARDDDLPAPLAAGVRRWSAPPTVTIDEPKNGTVVASRELAFRGRFSSGRPTDRVTLDGVVVTQKDGAWSATIVADPLRGERRIEVWVVDRGQIRATVACRVSFRFLWTDAVKSALDLGLSGDWKGAKAKLAEARAAGATDADLPASLRAGVAQYEAGLAPTTEAERLMIPLAFENPIGMKFTLIPSGKFTMGSPPDEPDREAEETQHEVTLTTPFYMAVSLTTNSQYRKFKPDHRSGDGLDADDQPVVEVSHDDATAFVTWLSSADSSRVYRLPTEAEWEYACRAGTTTPYWFGATITPERANYGDNRGTTTPAGAFPANPWGLYDMHGNVWEWCSDWYGAYPSAALVDPVGPASGLSRVKRGGSWSAVWGSANHLRSASRWGLYRPDYRSYMCGFRVAATAARPH